MRSYDVEWYHLVPSHVKEILQRLQAKGRKAYIAGGAVRDLWLGLTPKDFDLVSEASVEEIEALFPKTLDVGRAFGIMIVVTDQGPVEIARFRADGAYTDSRHPDVVIFADPEQDAKRRDFTINGLFYDPLEEKVLDYVGGAEDLEKKLIRCVGEPSLRFEEDALRMLRAVRFRAQLGHLDFTLEGATLTAAAKLKDKLSLVSRERITQEVSRIFMSPRPSFGLIDLAAAGMWPFAFSCGAPKVTELKKMDLLSSLYRKTFREEAEISLFLAALRFSANGESCEKNLILGKDAKARIEGSLKLLKVLPGFNGLDLAGQKQLLADPAFPDAWVIASVFEMLHGPEDLPALRSQWEKEGKLSPPILLDGNELMSLGIPKGPEVRKVMDEIRRMQLNEKLQSKDEAIAFVKELKSP